MRGLAIRSIIWDLGGTLLDTYPDVDLALATAAFGPDGPERLPEVAALTRVSSGHAITELADRSGTSEGELRAAYDGVKELWKTRPAPVMSGAREVMAAVAEGGGLNLIATHRDRTSAEQLVRATGIVVDDMVCAPDGFARKPSPEMITELMRRHGLGATAAFVVGDRPGDARAGLAAGIAGVLLATPGIRFDVGDEIHQIHHLRELLPMVSGG